MLLSELSAVTLRSIVSYDPETGLFTRLSTGLITGFPHKRKKYINVAIGTKKHRAHRLAWLYMTGQHPSGVIDHINQNRVDNRWVNLRDTSNMLNLHNRTKANKNGSTGVLGVTNAYNGRFKARLMFNGKRTHLGYFDTLEAAQSAYLTAKAAHHII